MVAEPLNKKRKLQVSSSVSKQPSFTDVLEQLEAEGDDAGGTQLAGSFDSKLIEKTLSRHRLRGLDLLLLDSIAARIRFVSSATWLEV
jgi:hypothetical protein